MRKINKILLLFIILIFCIIKNVSYAGFFPEYQSIEINLKKYNNNNITVKKENGKILETNEAGYDKIENGMTTYGSLIVEKGPQTTIENIYFSGDRTDFINTIIVEITNNEGKIDVIRCDFEFGKSQYYKLNYNCDNGKINDISFIKTGMLLIEEYWKVVLFIVCVIIFICIVITKTIKDFILKNKYT